MPITCFTNIHSFTFIINLVTVNTIIIPILGLPGGTSGKELTCQSRRLKSWEDPWRMGIVTHFSISKGNHILYWFLWFLIAVLRYTFLFFNFQFKRNTSNAGQIQIYTIQYKLPFLLSCVFNIVWSSLSCHVKHVSLCLLHYHLHPPCFL